MVTVNNGLPGEATQGNGKKTRNYTDYFRLTPTNIANELCFPAGMRVLALGAFSLRQKLPERLRLLFGRAAGLSLTRIEYL